SADHGARGSIVGDLAIIDGLPRSASVVALADSKLRFISRESFQACAQRHPEIHEYLVTLLASRLRETDKTIAALAFLSAKGPRGTRADRDCRSCENTGSNGIP